MIIIMEGPDGCGKTNIGHKLSWELGCNYFKVSTEHENWRKNSFKEALEYDQTYLAEFLSSVECDVVIDRAYPSEYVYSHVFKRDTNLPLIKKIDEKFATVGAIIVICMRRDYSKVEDELVAVDKLDALHHMYWAFFSETKCHCVVMYVDDYGNDLNKQIPKLKEAIAQISLRENGDTLKLIISKELENEEETA